MIGWTPIANFKISLLFASGVSIAIGFAEGAYRVLTGCVIVSEVVWIVRQLVVGFRIADAHCLGVCLRESSVVFSARHSQLLSRVTLVRGAGRTRGQLRLLVRSQVSGPHIFSNYGHSDTHLLGDFTGSRGYSSIESVHAVANTSVRL